MKTSCKHFHYTHEKFPKFVYRTCRRLRRWWFFYFFETLRDGLVKIDGKPSLLRFLMHSRSSVQLVWCPCPLWLSKVFLGEKKKCKSFVFSGCDRIDDDQLSKDRWKLCTPCDKCLSSPPILVLLKRIGWQTEKGIWFELAAENKLQLEISKTRDQSGNWFENVPFYTRSWKNFVDGHWPTTLPG